MINFAIKFEKGTSPEEVIKVMQVLKSNYRCVEKDYEWNVGELSSSYYRRETSNFYITNVNDRGLQIHNHSANQTVYTVQEIYDKLNDIKSKFCLNGSVKLEQYFYEIGVTKSSPRYDRALVVGGHSIGGGFIHHHYYQVNGKWDTSVEKPEGYTLITFEEFINNQQPKNQTDMSTTTNTPTLSITKTDTVLIGKKKREITITVLLDSNRVRSGYSVRNPEDKKSDPTLAKQISTGRAQSDKTNLTPDMYIGHGTDKKFILYAIAEQLFRELNSGKIEIKGIK